MSLHLVGNQMEEEVHSHPTPMRLKMLNHNTATFSGEKSQWKKVVPQSGWIVGTSPFDKLS